MKFSHTLCPNAFGDPQTLPLASPWGWHLWFWVTSLKNYWMVCHKICIHVPLKMNYNLLVCARLWFVTKFLQSQHTHHPQLYSTFCLVLISIITKSMSVYWCLRVDSRDFRHLFHSKIQLNAVHILVTIPNDKLDLWDVYQDQVCVYAKRNRLNNMVTLVFCLKNPVTVGLYLQYCSDFWQWKCNVSKYNK